MIHESESRKDGKTCAGISLFLSESTKGLPGLTSLYEGKIPINSTCSFTTNALQKVLGFNPGTFWSINYQLRFCPIMLPNSSSKEKLNISILPGMKPGIAASKTTPLPSNNLPIGNLQSSDILPHFIHPSRSGLFLLPVSVFSIAFLAISLPFIL